MGDKPKKEKKTKKAKKEPQESPDAEPQELPAQKKSKKKRPADSKPEQPAPAGGLASALFGNSAPESKTGLADMFAAPKASKFAKIEPQDGGDQEQEEATEGAPAEEAEGSRPKISKEHKDQKRVEAERLTRTVFVGNVPVSCIKKQSKLKAVFAKFGPVESVRFRSIPFAEGTKHRRAAVIKGDAFSGRGSCNAYLVFKEANDAQAAAKDGNGEVLDGLTMRADMATAPGKHPELKQADHRKGIFLGNLPFDIEEEALREHFNECGQIANVRIVRDRGSNLGKGIGFIQFTDRDAVALAVEHDGAKLGGREIRVSRLKKQGQEAQGTKRPRDDSSGGAKPEWHGKDSGEEGSTRKKKKNVNKALDGVKTKKKKARDPEKRAARAAKRQKMRKQ